MVAICFGGLKLLIGVIIYGAWIFALIFRPEYLRKKEQEEAKTDDPATKGWLSRWGTTVEIVVLLIGILAIVIVKAN